MASFGMAADAEDVVVEDSAVFRALQAHDDIGLGRDWARSVTASIMADRQMSPNDQDIIRALQLSANGETVSFVSYSVAYAGLVKVMPADKLPDPGPNDVKRISIPRLPEQSAEFMNLVAPGFLEGVSTDDMWMVEERTKQLYYTAMTSPLVRVNMTRQIASKLYGPWTESSLTNGYAPFKHALGAADTMLKGASGDDEELLFFGRAVLCDAGRLIDENSSYAMPDHLYLYLTASQPGVQPCEK